MTTIKKQLKIPGTERKQLKDIEDAAVAYTKARDTRMAHTKKEVAARNVLLAAMKKHKLETYVDEDGAYEVTLTTEEKLRVTDREDGE